MISGETKPKARSAAPRQSGLSLDLSLLLAVPRHIHDHSVVAVLVAMLVLHPLELGSTLSRALEIRLAVLQFIR